MELSNAKKNEVLDKIQSPSATYLFPASGKRKLKFQHKWLSLWKWLSYSKKVDGAYCKYCVLFNAHAGVGLGQHQKMGQLCSEKFNNWKKTKERFNDHEQLLYHRHNVEKASIILKIETGIQDPIHLQINQEAKKQVLENRNKLKPIIETVLFCGKQGLALRGHRDGGRVTYEADENEGNFRELLRYRKKYDPVLEQTLSSSKCNAMYTSWKIQNEIIEICNDLILEKLIQKINASAYFSLLVDETTDISTIEQMSICIRCTNSTFNKIEELFLQFVPVADLTGRGLFNIIVTKLKCFGIDMGKLRGQGYDGAAAMSGKLKGVQAYFKESYPQAVYVHCAAHSLNLAVSDSCEVAAIRNCLGTIGKLYNFFHTPKRQSVLQQCLQETEVESSHEKLKPLCATRWVERYNSVAVFIELYDTIILALDKISEWTDKDSANTANQLNCSIKRADFYISLQVINQVFTYSNILCKLLQQRNIDLKKATNLAENTIAEIKQIRVNATKEFKKLFDNAKKQSEKYDFTMCTLRRSVKQTQRCNEDAHTSEDYYRISMYIPFLDGFINNLEQRFTNHKAVLVGFQSLLPIDPTKLTNETLEEFRSLVLFYKDDLNGTSEELIIELKFWYRLLLRVERDKWPKDALSALDYCDENMLPNIKILLRILAVLPVSTADNERTFSTLRRLKNYLRNSISENRLNGLTLLHMYRDITPTVDTILNKLAEKPRKLDINLN